ncbi:alkane 1-monooxygenase [Alteromonas oceanisediminis]|uniref:alkane 1-monooxygenase n=1 Tax=Alteromonas oceanisediminis TaxID=2836180 RepID=UPI001BDA23EC|nr:alkane 1-monooxygenase [Alteromonas oceanisediminis]MBT0587251.1 alkane 1-monooxygenase [Alteromonas oceanisediminis]
MLFHHIKFFSYYLFALLGMLAILAGDHWVIIGYLTFMSFFVLGDALFGDDISTPDYRYPRLLTAALWLALPMSILVMLSGAWLVTPIGESVLSDGVLSGANLLDIAVMTGREATDFHEVIFAMLFCGLMVGGVGTISAHELVHRVGSRVHVTIGRWILALSFDANFSIEHVFGHHRYVATAEDPATAPRGRNVYSHIVLSTWYGNISAWNIEKKRLARQKKRPMSWSNRCLRGYAMSVCWLAAVYLIAGGYAVLFVSGAGLVAKAVLEIVNYMEHYGIVRDPKQRVQPRHSWNTNRRVSSWTMFNLCRHSHHHAQGAVPFDRLQPMPEAPTMVNGYMATLLLTLIPPLWRKIMQPKLNDWDVRYANEQERQLLAQQLSARD